MADKTVDDTIDADSIGPQLPLDDVELPAAVGRQIARVHGESGTVETGAEWVATTRDALGDPGQTPTVEDLCTSPDGRHTFESSESSQSYVCVLDPLIYPFLADTPGTVRSTTPVEDGIAMSGELATALFG